MSKQIATWHLTRNNKQKIKLNIIHIRNALLYFVLSFLFNPIYILLLFALNSFLIETGWLSSFFISINIATFLTARQYGIKWSEESYDDAPAYISAYNYAQNASLQDLIIPGNHYLYGFEPGLMFFWKTLGNLGFDINSILFIQHLCPILATYYFARSIYPRFGNFIASFIILASPAFLISVAHLYRQDLAYSIFVVILAHIVSKRKNPLWLLVSTLFHVSSILPAALTGLNLWITSTRHVLARFISLISFIALILILYNLFDVSSLFISKYEHYSSGGGAMVATTLIMWFFVACYSFILGYFSGLRYGIGISICAVLTLFWALINPDIFRGVDRMLSFLQPVIIGYIVHSTLIMKNKLLSYSAKIASSLIIGLLTLKNIISSPVLDWASFGRGHDLLSGPIFILIFNY